MRQVVLLLFVLMMGAHALRAQGLAIDRLTEDLATSPVVDAALSDVTQPRPELVHPEFLPRRVDPAPRIVTKENEKDWELPFSLTCLRSPNDSVFFRLVLSPTGKLADFKQADLYQGGDLFDAAAMSMDTYPFPDGRATMKMLVPMCDTYQTDVTRATSTGWFQLPVAVAQRTFLRLHCVTPLAQGPIPAVHVDTYVVSLASFTPDVQEKTRLPPSEDGASVQVDIDF